jgi:hypothetical protein
LWARGALITRKRILDFLLKNASKKWEFLDWKKKETLIYFRLVEIDERPLSSAYNYDAIASIIFSPIQGCFR